MSTSDKQTSGQLKQIIVSNESEDERLLRDMNRPDMEKFRMFMQMLRANKVLKRITVTHK